MSRIATGSQAAALPTHAGATGTPGYFVDEGTTPSGAPTQLDANWCNHTQEARVRVIEDAGLTPSRTDFTQFPTAVGGVHAIKSHSTDTGNVTTAKTRGVFAGEGRASGPKSAVIASINVLGSYPHASGTASACIASLGGTASGNYALHQGAGSTVSGNYSAAVGSSACTVSGSRALASGESNTASGDYSVALGGTSNTASGARAAVLGGKDNAVSGQYSAAAGSLACTVSQACSATIACDTVTVDETTSAAIGCDSSKIGNATSKIVLLASTNTHLAKSKTTGGTAYAVVGGGYSGSALAGTETANTNVTWTIDSTTGDFRGGAFLTEDPNADFAEMAETLDGEIPIGALVTNVGRKVRVAQPGDRLYGVVSATPAVLAGAADLGYSGRFARDEWGRALWDDVECVRWADYTGPAAAAPQPVPDEVERYTARVRREAPSYDKTRAYTSRTDRPAEWCPVAKLGMVRVRCARGVKPGDELTPGKDGVAQTGKGTGRRWLEALEVLSPYDAARGYAVVLCEVG